MDLWRRGHSFPVIARAVGTSIATTYRDVVEGIAEITREPARKLRHSRGAKQTNKPTSRQGSQNRNGATPQHQPKQVGPLMPPFKQYRRKRIAELRPYEPGENLDGISISDHDKEAGSPKIGDMIARNPTNHADQWLVSALYFADNFEPL